MLSVSVAVDMSVRADHLKILFDVWRIKSNEKTAEEKLSNERSDVGR